MKQKKLQDLDGTLCLDSQDLDWIKDHYPRIKNRIGDITGSITKIGDGEIVELWVTTTNAPYLNDAIYFQVV